MGRKSCERKGLLDFSHFSVSLISISRFSTSVTLRSMAAGTRTFASGGRDGAANTFGEVNLGRHVVVFDGLMVHRLAALHN